MRNAVEHAFERRAEATADERHELLHIIAEGISLLDRGLIRAARPESDAWIVEAWVKKLILLSFLVGEFHLGNHVVGAPRSWDKLPLKFERWTTDDFSNSGIRVVPGAVVRRGAHIAPGVVIMPSFVNVGAYIGERTMIDTWATVGSCAQIGARCHISGGAGIGGVLEPIGDAPVIIEDDVFVGARAEIAEGVRVRRGAVIAMGVLLGRSTPIIDRATGSVTTGEVPENAVVVPGSRALPDKPDLSTYAAVIVKIADDRTRSRTAINDLVRVSGR